MNFLALKTRVRETASLPSEDAATVGEFVNEAYRDFCRDAATNPERFSFTLTANDGTYPLSSIAGADAGILRFLSIAVGASGERATLVDVVELDELLLMSESNTTASVPTHCAFLGLDSVELYPAPSTALVLSGFYVPRPAELSADTDTPAVPLEYHRAIRYRATQLAMEWDGQAEAPEWEQRYYSMVGAALKQRKRMSGSRPKQLKPSANLGGAGRDTNPAWWDA